MVITVHGLMSVRGPWIFFFFFGLEENDCFIDFTNVIPFLEKILLRIKKFLTIFSIFVIAFL